MPGFNLKFSRAFSFIELLIVIAILGILGSIVSLAIINHQKKARDVQRKNDLQVVKKALETAKNDCRNASGYPSITQNIAGYSKQTYVDRLVKNYLLNSNTQYLKTFINDPKFSQSTYDENSQAASSYEYNNANLAGGAVPQAGCRTTAETNTLTGVTYWALRAKLENTTDPDSAKTYDKCVDAINGLNATRWQNPPPAPNGDGYYYVCSE